MDHRINCESYIIKNWTEERSCLNCPKEMKIGDSIYEKDPELGEYFCSPECLIEWYAIEKEAKYLKERIK